MKYTSILPITLAALAFTGCTMFSNTQTNPIVPPANTPPVAVVTEPITTAIPAIPEDITKTPTTPNGTAPVKTTTPADKDIPKTTVSTEDLTKELDSFVDDITKGL